MELNLNQEVVVIRSGSRGYVNRKFGRVEKISPSGQIFVRLENDVLLRFLKDGNEYGARYPAYISKRVAYERKQDAAQEAQIRVAMIGGQLSALKAPLNPDEYEAYAASVAELSGLLSEAVAAYKAAAAAANDAAVSKD